MTLNGPSITTGRWRKLGHVYTANEPGGWRSSHAFVPTPLLMVDRIRVFSAFLDSDSVGRVGYVDVDLQTPTRVIAVSPEPVLDVGEPGTFDDCGATPVQVLEQGAALWLFYNGWQRSARVPYHILSGLAVSDDGGLSFRRASRVPVLERTDTSWLVRSTPFVLPPVVAGEPWRMWYSAGGGHVHRGAGAGWAPRYGIAYAESADGRGWPAVDQSVRIEMRDEEFGLTRPVVERDGDGFRMLLSVRSLDRIYTLERGKLTVWSAAPKAGTAR